MIHSGDTWQVVGPECGSAEALLAAGMARFDAMTPDAPPVLRWYRSDAPAIVLGRGQRGLALTAGTHPVVTRSSGGGAVWLSPDVLSLDVLVPAGHPWHADDLGDVFLHVGGRWAAALGALGVDDLSVHDGPAEARRRGTPRERLLAAVCYATRGRGEVLWRGRKLVGLAQRRRRHGAMVQCGLLRTWEPGPLLERLGAEPDDADVTGAAVGLTEIRAAPPSDAAVIRAVEQEFGAPRR